MYDVLTGSNSHRKMRMWLMKRVMLVWAIVTAGLLLGCSSTESHIAAACFNNSRIIDSAKEQWAMTERKVDGDESDVSGVNTYLKQVPSCVGGGTYEYNAIGANPVCSIAEHNELYERWVRDGRR